MGVKGSCQLWKVTDVLRFDAVVNFGPSMSDITDAVSRALCYSGDSLSSLQKAIEQKESSRQQLREQLDAVERETRAKLLEIDAFNTQLKVIKHQMRVKPWLYPMD